MTKNEEIRQDLTDKWNKVIQFTIGVVTKSFPSSWDNIMLAWERVRAAAAKEEVYTLFWHDIQSDMDLAFNFIPGSMAKDHAVETLYRAVKTIQQHMAEPTKQSP